ncbi:MAG: hypothetical protein QNI87_04410 [Erythrobacter sp.]|uniref:hypothetical protein n=1 Tax=Erythrobacter sp. TaxID=1042 RepID=UPI002602D59F|nr:hypothetical protein [Erythrobacter sp.]MDJ0977757.1 hypothetical protein [Erythrobacter sp.]
MPRSLIAPASALALAALASAQAAHAQQACVVAEDAADAVVYAMPLAYDATMQTCDAQMGPDSFLRSADGRNFFEQFRVQQDERWQGTFRFLKVFIEQEADGDDGMGQMIAALPEESLRPFVDGLAAQMLAEEIKPDTCEKISRGAELLSPLPAENVGGLVAFILEMVDLDNPPVCGPDGTVTVIPEGPLSEEDEVE